MYVAECDYNKIKFTYAIAFMCCYLTYTTDLDKGSQIGSCVQYVRFPFQDDLIQTWTQTQKKFIQQK